MELDVQMNDDFIAITVCLANVVIARQLSAKTVLTGIHAFLMALHASGHADADLVSKELLRMACYYRSLRCEALVS